MVCEGGSQGGSGGEEASTPPLFSLSFLFVISFCQSVLFCYFRFFTCSMLLPQLSFLWRQTLTASISSLSNTPQHQFLPNPIPSIRLLFLWLCVLRKKLIMFLISRVFQSPSKRDERETGRRETEVVVGVGEVG